MGFDICLMKLQFKRQKWFYSFPILFLYLFLLPYQRQLFVSGDQKEEILREIFSLNQKYLILFGLWYSFLCFRMILNDEMKELNWCLDARYRFRWIFYWQIIYLGVLFPYIVWIVRHMAGYEENIVTVLLQIFCFSFELYVWLQLTGSPFVSFCIMLVWYFLCINQLVPEEISGMRINYLAGEIETSWYFWQAGLGIMLLIMGESIGRKGFRKRS